MHQHINKLENLVGKYKAQIHVPETDIQELAKQPTLSQGLGMQVCMRNLLMKNRYSKKRGKVCHSIILEKLTHSSHTSAEQERGSCTEGWRKDRGA